MKNTVRGGWTRPKKEEQAVRPAPGPTKKGKGQVSRFTLPAHRTENFPSVSREQAVQFIKLSENSDRIRKAACRPRPEIQDSPSLQERKQFRRVKNFHD